MLGLVAATEQTLGGSMPDSEADMKENQDVEESKWIKGH